MENTGWVKIHRKIIDWEWYGDINTRLVFFHLLLVCNRKDKKWRGIIVESGETIRSLETLAKEIGLSIQSTRTAIRNLKSTGEVTERKIGFYRLLKIKNYCKYQDNNITSNKTSTTLQQDINRTSTHNKNDKNDKNDKKGEGGNTIFEKSSLFLSEVEKFLEGKKLSDEQKIEMRKFVSYWTESNKGKTKIRWEMEKTWDLNRRIARWMSNNSFSDKKVINKIVKV